MHDVKRDTPENDMGVHKEPALEKVEVDETGCEKVEEVVVDFGNFIGTVTAEGTLDIRKFIDTAINLPSFKKKYRGMKIEPPT